MSTLSLLELTKQFGEVKAVNKVSFAVGDGEFLCILGPSGCGKSTALRMIAGFEDPTGGDVQIDGSSVLDLPPNRRPTAMVFQKYTLWPHMKIFDNIAFGLRLRRLPQAEIDRKVNDALSLVGLASYGPRFPMQLSGGEQQRVALARALVLEPKILLLDEPFSNLDALLRVRLREELRRIQRQVKITAIFVTHDQEEALSLADRIAVMNKGRLEQLDKPGNIYANPQTLFVADFIGVMNLIPARLEGDHVRVGNYHLPLMAGESNEIASNGSASGDITVAIRPEEMALVPADYPDSWVGQIEQLIDLGHYRKTLVNVPQIGTIKVYLSKSLDLNEGETIHLYPSRYLLYRNEQAPIEIKRQVTAGEIVYSS